MQTALRKMGNSTGIIVPRAILSEIGITVGAAIDLRVEDGRLIGTPVKPVLRAGWAEAAQAIVPESEDEAAWRSFGTVEDDDLLW
jgi:antitoxin MazE